MLPSCDGCRAMYSDRKPPEEPPCETCRVLPMDENIDALRIFSIVKYQLIVSAGGAVDIYHEAIHKAMELYRTKNRLQCFEKVLLLARWWIDRLNKENENAAG